MRGYLIAANEFAFAKVNIFALHTLRFYTTATEINAGIATRVQPLRFGVKVKDVKLA